MKKSFFCFVSLALFCVSLAFSQVYIDASFYEIASESLESSPEVDSIEREIFRTNNSINNVKMMRGMKRVSNEVVIGVFRIRDKSSILKNYHVITALLFKCNVF